MIHFFDFFPFEFNGREVFPLRRALAFSTDTPFSSMSVNDRAAA